MPHDILIVQFEPWHLKYVSLRPEQQELIDSLAEYWGDIEAYGTCFVAAAGNDCGEPCAWTVLDAGNPILCGGIYELNKAVGEAWTLVSTDFIDADLRVIIEVVRYIKDVLDRVDYTRVQSNTEVSFKEGQRFLEMLGFEKEGIARKYTPTGEDSVLYAKIKEIE